MQRCTAVVFAFLLTLSAVRGQAGDKLRPMTVDDIMKVRYLMETALSPDGTQVLYAVSEADLKEGRYNTDLWMVPFGGGTPVKLTNAPTRDDTPRWSPDGKKVGFVSDR